MTPINTSLTRQPVTASIHPDLLEKLLTALHPVHFDENSTLFHMGVEKCKTDFREILNYHINSA